MAGLLGGIFDLMGLQDSLGSNGLLGNFDGAFASKDGQPPRGMLMSALVDKPAERKATADLMSQIGGLMGGPLPGAAPPQAPSRPAPSGNAADAIASIESGGRYDAMGPVTKTGDRAYGKYQVMGANIGPWTKEILGQPLTPEQFLKTPEAQDAVFNGKFGQYAQKYGPEGAAKAWFAGESGMNNPNARDQLGTTVSAYAQKFNSAMGGPQQQPVRMASADPGQVPMGSTQPSPMMPPPQAQPPAAPPQQMAQAQQQPAQPQQGGVPKELGGLINALMNPRLSPAQRQTGTTMLNHMLDQSKLTETQKDYIRSKADPGFADYKRPPEMKMLKDTLGNEVPYSFNQNNQQLKPLDVPKVQGSAPPDEVVTKLRKEIQDIPSYKNVAQSAPVYRSMLTAASRDNRAADVNLIYGFAKLMDPGSVVRESEMTIAQAISTLPQHLQSTIASQLSGSGRLSPEVRSAIMQEAHSRATSYKEMFDIDASQFKGIAQRRNMNLDDVIPSFGEFKEWTPPKQQKSDQPAQQSAPPQGAPPNAKQAPDGKFYVPDPRRPGKYLMVQ